jgi:gamma-glutamyltranspeptidase/glutathione hydrolase
VASVAKTVLGVLAWGDTPQEAAGRANIIARGQTVRVEVSRPGGAEAAQSLRDLGYSVAESESEASGLHLIQITEDGLLGGADPRREGAALGLP